MFENVGGMEGDDVYINIEAAVCAAGKNNDDIDDDNFMIMDWKQDPGERVRRIWDYWRTIMTDKQHLVPFFSKAENLLLMQCNHQVQQRSMYFLS